MSQLSFAAIILAAGSGTRMKSAMPKVMHPIAGWPMIAYPLEALRPLSPAATLVVIAPRMDQVAATVAPADTGVAIGYAQATPTTENQIATILRRFWRRIDRSRLNRAR